MEWLRLCWRQPVRSRPGLSSAATIILALTRSALFWMSDQKVVLITGASSGVGQSTARLLSHEGYKVFGTSRNPAGSEAIPTVEMLALDVQSDDSVAACVRAVARKPVELMYW